MNHLEAVVRWNKEIPFELREGITSPGHPSVNLRDGLSVELSFKKPPQFFEELYSGQLSSIKSLHGYLSHLVWITAGRNTPLVQTKEIIGKSKTFEFIIPNFDLEGSDIKVLRIPFKKINPDRVKDLKKYLDAIKIRHFVFPRKENVNRCDFYGFLGSSGNMWEYSPYPRGNPGEMAEQIAWEVETGLKRSGFYPYEFSSEGLKGKQRGAVEKINRVIGENYKLRYGADIAIKALKGAAEDYYSSFVKK